jgi:hypothetical protein
VRKLSKQTRVTSLNHNRYMVFRQSKNHFSGNYILNKPRERGALIDKDVMGRGNISFFY